MTGVASDSGQDCLHYNPAQLLSSCVALNRSSSLSVSQLPCLKSGDVNDQALRVLVRKSVGLSTHLDRCLTQQRAGTRGHCS